MFKPRRSFNLKVVPKNNNGKCEVQFNEIPDDLTISIFNAMGFYKPKNSLVFIADEPNKLESQEFATLMQEHLKLGEYPIDIPYKSSFTSDINSVEDKNFSVFSIRFKDENGNTEIDNQISFETLEPRKKGIANVYGMTEYGDKFLSASIASRPKKADGKKLFYSEKIYDAFPFPFGNGLKVNTQKNVSQKSETQKRETKVGVQKSATQIRQKENGAQKSVTQIGDSNMEQRLKSPNGEPISNDEQTIAITKIDTQKSELQKSVTQKSDSKNDVQKSETQISEKENDVQKSVTQISEKENEAKKTVESDKSKAPPFDSKILKANFRILEKLIPDLLYEIKRGVHYSESLSNESQFGKVIFKVISDKSNKLIDIFLELQPSKFTHRSKIELNIRLNSKKKKAIVTNSHLKNEKNEILMHPDFKQSEFVPLMRELLAHGHLFALTEETIVESNQSNNENAVKIETIKDGLSTIKTIRLTADEVEVFDHWQTANEWLENQLKKPDEENKIEYCIKWNNGIELISSFELFIEDFHPLYENEVLQKAVIQYLLKQHYIQENRFVDLGGNQSKSNIEMGYYLNLLGELDLGNSIENVKENYQPIIPIVSLDVKTNILVEKNKAGSNRKFETTNEFLQLLKIHADPEELIEIVATWKDGSFINTSVKMAAVPKKPNATFWKTIFQSKLTTKPFEEYQTSDDDPLLFDSEIELEKPSFYFQDLENAYWHETDTELNQRIHFYGYSYHHQFLSTTIQEFLKVLTEEEENEIIELAKKNPRQKNVLQFIIEFKKLEPNDSNLQVATVAQMIKDAAVHRKLKSQHILYGLLLRFESGGMLIDLPKSRITSKKIELSSTNESKRIKLNREVEALIDKKGNFLTLYSYEDIELIKKYSGYGGSKVAETNRGLLYEYYTPDEIIKLMWGFAYTHGYKSGAILEPSCGIGKFIEHAPKNVRIEGYETNKYSAQIAKLLYNNADIHNKSFENLFFNGNVYLKGQFRTDPFDLVIGNPPYGSFSGKFAGMGEKKRTKALTYDQYFITRGLDVLVENGLLIMVIPQSFLDNSSKYLSLKEQIAEKAELLEARRLPHGIFQHTEIGTDIVVFRKTKSNEK